MYAKTLIFIEVSGMRENIQLECTTCKKMRYTSTKNKRNTPDRLEFRKYCKFCRSHQPFRETK